DPIADDRNADGVGVHDPVGVEDEAGRSRGGRGGHRNPPSLGLGVVSARTVTRNTCHCNPVVRDRPVRLTGLQWHVLRAILGGPRTAPIGPETPRWRRGGGTAG